MQEETGAAQGNKIEGGIIADSRTELKQFHSAMMNESLWSLQYWNNQTGRNWCLDFIEKPDRRVFFHGAEPTTDEILYALKTSNYPIIMVGIIQIIIADAIERNDSIERNK